MKIGGHGIGLSDPYVEDDITYFAPGPEFKLTGEEAARRKFHAEQRLQALGTAP